MKINLNSKSKRKIILSGLSAAVVILIVAISIFSVVKIKNENKQKANPELARAMTYGELTEKDDYQFNDFTIHRKGH